MKGTSHTYNCDYCGKEITVNGYSMKIYKTHFCSRECDTAYRRSGALRGRNHPNYNKVEVECTNCQKKLMRPKHDAEKDKNFYCNRACMAEHRNKTGYYKGENNANYKTGKAEIECGYCKELISVKQHRLNTKSGLVFCSHECHGKWTSENKKGEDYGLSRVV